MTTDLCKLASAHYVDKCPQYNHTYTPQYDALFRESRNDIKLLLEIGIGNVPLMKPLTGVDYTPGASLRMWRDYFQKAQIIGCDILKNVQFKEHNIQTFVTDQSNVDSLNKLIQNVKTFNDYADIIIDDGSHKEEHMVTSFKTLWKLVRPSGGIYVIEDVDLRFIERITNLHKEGGFTDANIKQIYRGKNQWDNFVVFQKI
jgi:hypothetical protein